MGFSILFFTALFFLHRKRSVETWQRAIVTVNNRCLFFALPSSNSSNSGTAVISLLFSSVASCPNTAFALLAHALTMNVPSAGGGSRGIRRNARMVIFMGPHRSGKTYYFNWHFAGKFIHIQSDEQQTGSEEQMYVGECLENGVDFVIEITNSTKAGRSVYIQNAKAAGYRIIGYLFSTQISDHYKQYGQGNNPELLYSEIVPADFSLLELPSYSEGYDELYYVEQMGSYHRDGNTNPMVKRDWSDKG